MLALTDTGKQEFMRKNNPDSQTVAQTECYLPNFCQAEVNLRLILVLELMAIVLALASAPTVGSLYAHLALISMYLQWVGLSSAALLCLLGRLAVLRGSLQTSLISLLVVASVTALLTVLSYRINDLLRLELFQQQGLWAVILQHQAVSLILFGLALRYFYVQHASRQMIKSESVARLQALQARIRPHFLFNSLNTIASLTYDQPEKADRAIESLAELFRASLKADTMISLNSEIELTRDYISLEALRLGDRLRVSWQMDMETDDLTMPALILQPLVENAIYHGIEPLQHGGEVLIALSRAEALLIEISNPLNNQGAMQHRPGNQMALENIQERLGLAYQGRAKIEHLIENELYKVKIKIPIQKKHKT